MNSATIDGLAAAGNGTSQHAGPATRLSSQWTARIARSRRPGQARTAAGWAA